MIDDYKIYRFDENGKPYVLDEHGNKRPPIQSVKNPDDGSGFTTFDDSQGHCPLCGNISCRGGCFK